MTKPNPFDLAIFALKRERDKAVIDDPCPICSYEAAIRLLEAAGKAREAKDKYVMAGFSEWGNYMTAIGALTEAALRGSSNVGIGRQSDGPGSSPGPRFSALPDEVKP